MNSFFFYFRPVIYTVDFLQCEIIIYLNERLCIGSWILFFWSYNLEIICLKYKHYKWLHIVHTTVLLHRMYYILLIALFWNCLLDCYGQRDTCISMTCLVQCTCRLLEPCMQLLQNDIVMHFVFWNTINLFFISSCRTYWHQLVLMKQRMHGMLVLRVRFQEVQVLCLLLHHPLHHLMCRRITPTQEVSTGQQVSGTNVSSHIVVCTWDK